MRRTRRSSSAKLAVTISLLCAALTGGGTAAAAPPTRLSASGDITLLSNTVNATKQAGRNTIVEALAVVDFAGTLTGQATEPYVSTTHANGTIKQRGTGLFTGTVAGRTGTIFYVFHGDATSGVITVTRGTAGLRGVHGKLAYQLSSTSPTAVFSYVGSIWFT